MSQLHVLDGVFSCKHLFNILYIHYFCSMTLPRSKWWHKNRDCIITNMVFYREKLKYSHNVRLMFTGVSSGCSAHENLLQRCETFRYGKAVGYWHSRGRMDLIADHKSINRETNASVSSTQQASTPRL